MAETEVCLICALISVISNFITIALGLKIMSKYFKYKRKELIFVGVTFILIWSAWWPSTISFFIYIINGGGLPYVMYIFLGGFFLPYALLTWDMAMFSLLNFEKKAKQIGYILTIIYVVAFNALVFYYMVNPTELGYLRNPLVPAYSFTFYFAMFPLIIAFFVISIVFALETFKSEDLETKLKGKFILIACFVLIAGIMMEIFTFGDILLLTSRIIIVIGMILIYIGFVLPKKVRDLILKDQKN